MKEPLTDQQKAHNKSLKQFRTKVKRSITTHGLHSGELLLEYWKSDKPKGVSIEENGLNEQEITDIVEQQVNSYKSSLPTQ